MKYISRLLLNPLSVFACLQIFLLPGSSYAYIDPNTGGFFFQTVFPFVATILGAIVIFWKRLVNVIRGFFSRKKEDDDK